MRILVATTAFPLPEHDGLDLLVAGVLRELRRSHEITLVAVVEDDSELERYDEVCTRLVPVRPPRSGHWARLHQELATLPGRRPVLAEQATEALSGPLAAAAAEHPYDVLHLMQSWTAELTSCAPGLPSVLSALDASRPNWESRIAASTGRLDRALSRRELTRMLRYERDAYPEVGRVVVVTDADAELVRRQSPRSAVRAIGNGIEMTRWRRPDAAVREPGLVVFTGALSYPPNVAAAVFAVDEVLPRLRQRVPDARLRLVGRDPSPELLARAGEHVEVTGTVPDVAPHLWAASAYLCPMTAGSGVKNKLLEALAAGAPCVATGLATLGAGVQDGVDVLVRETPQELADAVADVLHTPDLAARLADAGTARARQLSWAAVACAYEDLYAELGAQR